MCESCDVLQSSYQSANAMTYTLCDYGEGNMGQGVRKLAEESYVTGYVDGCITCLINGVIIISVLSIVGFTVKSIKRKVDNRKIKQEIYL